VRQIKRGKVGGSLLFAAAAVLFAASATAQQVGTPAADVPPSTLAAAVVPGAAQTQEAAIVITGSRIPRRNLTALSPISLVSKQEVRLEGAVLTETLINALPQVVPDQGMFLSNGATGTAAVDLRGFGASRTLVLVNGRRLLPGDATYAAADINFIPSSLISRVEVLTGGASSVYGSDAIAGVVNFILDQRLDGLRIDGQASFYQHNNRNKSGIGSLIEDSGFSSPTGNTVDGGIRDINAAYGLAFARGRGHITVYGGYRKSSGFTQDTRDYSSCAVTAAELEEPVFCGGSTTSAAGTFVIPNFGLRFHATPNRTFAPRPSFFNFAPYNYYQRPDRRYTTGIFADLELSDAFKPYFEGMYMDDKTVAQVAPSGDFGVTNRINCDNPLLSSQERGLVCFDGNYIGQRPVFDDDGNLIGIIGTPTGPFLQAGLRIMRRNVEGGPRIDTFQHRDLRLVGGAKGELARGLSYDASYIYGRVRQKQTHTNDFLTSRIARALDVVTDPSTGRPVCRSVLNGQDPDCVPWDVFAAGAASPGAPEYLEETTRLSGEVEQRVANVSFTAEFDEWGVQSPWSTEAAALNIGAEYRKDKLSVDPDQHFRDADVVGLGTPLLPLSGATTVKELFGEVRVPLLSDKVVHALILEGGYRLSWYSNTQNRFSTSSWKVGADLSIVHGLRIRASDQRAVRAPNVQELFALPFADNFDTDPCAGFVPAATLQQCQTSGVTAAQYGQIARQPDEDQGYNGIGGGNTQLGPEDATTRTIGLVLEPQFLHGFNMTVDWFEIRLKGAVGVIGSQTILDTCVATGDPIFCSRIHRDSEGSLWLSPDGFVDDREANIGALTTSGVDVGASYRRSLGPLGFASFEFQGTYTRRFTIDNGGLSTSYECAGLYGQICGFPLPRWRHNLRGTWTAKNGLSISALWRHFSAVPVDAELFRERSGHGYNDAVARISAQDYFDLTFGATISAKYRLNVGVRNLFDREPPLIATGQFGVCGSGFCNGNTYPQLYDPAGRFIFAGVTINLKPW
jgi:iron complex outermembrane receptor protein